MVLVLLELLLQFDWELKTLFELGWLYFVRLTLCRTPTIWDGYVLPNYLEFFSTSWSIMLVKILEHLPLDLNLILIQGTIGLNAF